LVFQGLFINIPLIVELCLSIASILLSVEIFFSAEIIPNLSCVSSTLQASAKNSFFLEIAKFISGKISIESKYKNNHKSGNAFHHSLLELEEECKGAERSKI
jgi:hypothetical protein